MQSNRWQIFSVLVAVVLVGAAVYLYLQEPSTLPAPSTTESPSDRALDAEGYTGAESCRECHQAESETWSKSAHARAMTIASSETVRGEWNTTHTFDGQTYRMFTRDGRYFIEAPNREGQPEAYPVVYTLGARQHENYLTRFPDGRYQVLPVYYDLHQKRWYDAAEGTLELGRVLKPTDFYFWTGQGRTWNRGCFNCHASQMRKNYNWETDTYDTVVGDLSINCEACHGPGATHIQFWRDAAEDPSLVNQEDRSLPKLDFLTSAQQVEVCAQCHALKTVWRSGFGPGDDFQDFFEPVLIDSDDFYWPDGLTKKLAYPYLQFAGSVCFRKGGLTCTGCHTTHGSDRTGELIADPRGVGLCARCHPGIASDVRGHTHHSPSGPGVDCNGCHVPRMFRNQLVMTDHRIAVPVPENTVQLGIPNACGQDGCHADQSAEWASAQATRLWGGYQGERVKRARVIDRGRQKDVAVLPDLMAILENGAEDPLLRAGVADLMGHMAKSEPISMLVEALSDSHSVVRAQSAEALGRIGHPMALNPLVGALSDSVFSVRIRAAFSLSVLGYAPVGDQPKQEFESALTEFQAIAEKGLLADDPGMHVTVGQVYEFQHNYEAALQHYRYALHFASGLADAQDRTQRLMEGEARFKKLKEILTPVINKDVRAMVAMGMARVHRGEAQEGLGLLKQASGMGVRSELLEVGLGEAYRKLGQFDQAEQHYRMALQLWDGFPDAYKGLAYLAYARGQAEAGAEYWQKFQAAKAAAEGAWRVKEFLGR